MSTNNNTVEITIDKLKYTSIKYNIHPNQNEREEEKSTKCFKRCVSNLSMDFKERDDFIFYEISENSDKMVMLDILQLEIGRKYFVEKKCKFANTFRKYFTIILSFMHSLYFPKTFQKAITDFLNTNI